jgi:glycine/D-amino acid oxidase-like deaminating enzyme
VTPDVLVVGAGLAGAWIAHECALAGLRVRLVDRAAAAGMGATRWSQAGMSWVSALANPNLRPLVVDGWRRAHSLDEELGLPTTFREVDYFSIMTRADSIERARPLIELGLAHGFAGRIVTPADAAGLEPAARLEGAVAVAITTGGNVDPTVYVDSILQSARRRGAAVEFGVDVHALQMDGGRCRGVLTATGVIEAGVVVLAAGAWTRTLLRDAGLDLRLLHTHAEILICEPSSTPLRHYIGVAEPSRAELETAMAAPELADRWDETSLDEIIPAGVQVGAVQLANGEIRLGQVSRAIPGFLGGPRADGEAAIRARAAIHYPGLAALPATLCGAPVAISADRVPIGGAFGDVPNLFVAAGYDSPFIYMPALAQRIAAAIASGDQAPLAPFSPDRLR